MQHINMIMIYYLDKKFKKWLQVLEVDIIIFKNWFAVSSSNDAFFTGRVPNDRYCSDLSNKSLLY